MARTTSANYTSPSFPIASADGDAFDANDIQQLAAAVNGHDHTTGKGVVITPGTSGGSTKYAEVVLLSAQASVTLPVSGSLPQTYRSIRIMYQARCDASVNTAFLNLQINGDSTANYDSAQLYGFQSSSGGGGSVAATSMGIGEITGATSPANTAGGGQIFIPNYSGTTFTKSANTTFWNNKAYSAGNLLTELYGGDWRSTAAITTLRFSPSTGNFVAGSTFTLYLE